MNVRSSSRPLVSIIIGSYNHEKFVSKTLQSIFAQTYNNIEIIVIDDCSKDTTPDIIQTELKTYTGLHTFIRKEKNKGVADSFRMGISMSKGDYVLTFSSDDLLPPTAIQDRVEYMEGNKEYTFIHTNADIIDDLGRPWFDSDNLELRREGEVLTEHYDKYKAASVDDLLKYMLSYGNTIVACSIMWKKEANDIVMTYDDHLTLCQDYDVNLRSLVKYEWGYLSKSTVQYRLHPHNTNKSLAPDTAVTKHIHQYSIMFAKLYDEVMKLNDKAYRDEVLNLLLPNAYYYWFNDSNIRYEKKARRVLFKKFNNEYSWSDNYSLKFRIRAIIKILTGIDIKNLRRKLSAFKD